MHGSRGDVVDEDGGNELVQVVHDRNDRDDELGRRLFDQVDNHDRAGPGGQHRLPGQHFEPWQLNASAPWEPRST